MGANGDDDGGDGDAGTWFVEAPVDSQVFAAAPGPVPVDAARRRLGHRNSAQCEAAADGDAVAAADRVWHTPRPARL